jgi:flagellar hook-associated protein 2
MAAVSSLGIGSNLDLTSLLANIKSGEQAPLVALQKQQTAFTAKLSAYGQLSSALSALQTASATLAKAETFTGVKATASATDILSATAAAGATGGTYAINVTQLSQAQSLATAGVASSTTAIGTGSKTTLTLDFGTLSGGTLGADGKYTGASFAPDATRSASITIDASNNTLAGIRDAINGNTDMGVTASIVNDGSATPNRLVLTSKQTGETSSMRLIVTGQPAVLADPGPPEVLAADAVPADAAIAALLTHNPAGLPAAQLQQTAAAQNSQLTVNGIAVTSANNTVVDAAQGVTMTLAKLGTSSLTVQNDTASVEAAVNAFVKAYNGVQSVASKLGAFDADKATGGALLGDSVLRNSQVGIRSALTSAQADHGSGLTMLSNIGVSFQKDGTLATDTTKLKAALESKLSGVANLFAGNAGVGGYGTQMAALITSYTDTNGSLSSATKGINTRLDTLKDRYDKTQERIEATVARYKAQFTALDLMMSRMSATSTYLTQQFEALNQSTKN